VSRSERRENNRRSGQERRGNQRRLIVDRRYSSERRGRASVLLASESPAEHVRNAMQLLVSALESETTLTPEDFADLAESTLARLNLALSGLERRTR
jgi:hypothetical protein